MIKWPSTCTCCKGGNICSLQLSAAGGDEGFCQDYVAPPEGTIVRFHLNTFYQKDRVIVTSNPTNPCAPNISGATGDILFDTGCVGTGGYVDYDALIPAGSTTVRVIVIPNCEGGSGTAWNFTSSCIESCCTLNEVPSLARGWLYDPLLQAFYKDFDSPGVGKVISATLTGTFGVIPPGSQVDKQVKIYATGPGGMSGPILGFRSMRVVSYTPSSGQYGTYTLPDDWLEYVIPAGCTSIRIVVENPPDGVWPNLKIRCARIPSIAAVITCDSAVRNITGLSVSRDYCPNPIGYGFSNPVAGTQACSSWDIGSPGFALSRVVSVTVRHVGTSRPPATLGAIYAGTFRDGGASHVVASVPIPNPPGIGTVQTYTYHCVVSADGLSGSVTQI